MNDITAFAYDTYWLGLRTTRRFIRVPANLISIIFFPLIQLLVFSQLFKDIIQLPAFATDSYLAYLAPGQVVFAVVPGGGLGGLRDAGGVPHRLPRQAARHAHRAHRPSSPARWCRCSSRRRSSPA